MTVVDKSPEPASEVRRSRRAWLTGAAGAAAAVAASAMLPAATEATTPTVKLGVSNTASTGTTIKDSAHSSSAKALTGRTTYTGTSTNAAGLYGLTDGTDGNGVIGQASKGDQAIGVWGRSGTGTGVLGTGPLAVVGDATAFGGSTAVLGIGATDAVGVAGLTDPDGSGIGVYGSAGVGGWAGYFEGDVFVDGYLTSLDTVTMTVDHPEAPGTRWYQRAAVGAFERLTTISGNVRTDAKGHATVKVEALFADQHKDFRYQLTTIGSPARAWVSRVMQGHAFVVATDSPNIRVSWQVTAVRDDPAARASSFHPSVIKRGDERGRFAQPELYGKGAARSLGARRSSALQRRGQRLSRKLSSASDE